jgi:septum formation protein
VETTRSTGDAVTQVYQEPSYGPAAAGEAVLEVRDLSDDFIERYLAAEWPEVSQCVGVFRIESLGPQLFESIEGDMFTVLGKPELPVLGALRVGEELPA